MLLCAGAEAEAEAEAHLDAALFVRGCVRVAARVWFECVGARK